MRSRLPLTCIAALLSLTLTACEESSSTDSALTAPAIPTPSAVVSQRAAAGTVGIPVPKPQFFQMTKPRSLGPITPAIVAIPDRLREPSIRVRVTEEADTPPTVTKKYRGRLDTVRLPNGHYIKVNTLPIEQYVDGVMSAEMPASWQPAALRAQAVAARTFALYQILTGAPGRPYDVSNDTSSQVYGGIKSETARTTAAVDATSGQVLTANVANQTGVFCTFFSACSGGASQDPFEAWGDPRVSTLSARNLGPVDDNCADYRWGPMTISKTDLSRCIRNWAQVNEIAYLAALGQIESVTITKRNPTTNRPTEFTLTDARGITAPIRPEEFRLALLSDPAHAAPKPLSSFFQIKNVAGSIILSDGRGHGHAIGMSQWGAQSLALQGRTYTQILAFYYPGASLHEAW